MSSLTVRLNRHLLVWIQYGAPSKVMLRRIGMFCSIGGYLAILSLPNHTVVLNSQALNIGYIQACRLRIV